MFDVIGNVFKSTYFVLQVGIVFAIFAVARERDASKCNINRLPWHNLAIMGAEALLSFDHPVIFHSPVDEESKLEDLVSFTTMDNLILHYGDSAVQLSSSNAYSHGKIGSILEIYLNTIAASSRDLSSEFDDTKETLPADKVYYLFGDNYDGVWRDIINLYEVRYCGPACEIAGAKTPGIGGSNSGVSFHFHGPGFAEVIHGSKQWFFYPPAAKDLVDRVGNAENMTTYKWKSCILPLLRGDIYESDACKYIESVSDVERQVLVSTLQECTIYPNELLFFPKYWMHSTLNLDAYNVFISTFMDQQLLERGALNSKSEL